MKDSMFVFVNNYQIIKTYFMKKSVPPQPLDITYNYS